MERPSASSQPAPASVTAEWPRKLLYLTAKWPADESIHRLAQPQCTWSRHRRQLLRVVLILQQDQCTQTWVVTPERGTSRLAAVGPVWFGSGRAAQSEKLRQVAVCNRARCIVGDRPAKDNIKGTLGHAAWDVTVRPSHLRKLCLACQNIHSRLSPPKYCTACHADCRFNAAYTPASLPGAVSGGTQGCKQKLAESPTCKSQQDDTNFTPGKSNGQQTSEAQL